jgi:hypothetical protein
VADVEKYSAVFWEKIKTIEGGPHLVERIEKAEESQNKLGQIEELLNSKFMPINNQFSIKNIAIPYTKNSKRHEGDALILYAIYKYGYGRWDLILNEIRNSQEYVLNWSIHLMGTVEVKKKADALIALLKAENDKKQSKKTKVQIPGKLLKNHKKSKKVKKRSSSSSEESN